VADRVCALGEGETKIFAGSTELAGQASL